MKSSLQAMLTEKVQSPTPEMLRKTYRLFQPGFLVSASGLPAQKPKYLSSLELKASYISNIKGGTPK